MSAATLFWGLLFGSIGFGMFVYGKRQAAPVPLACGVGLMLVPYVVTNSYALVAVGVVLLALPYFLRH